MVDEATYHELDRYFRNAMNTEERHAFEARLKHSEELRSELQWLNTLIGGMKQQGKSIMKQTIANAITGISAQQLQKYTPAKNPKSLLKTWWWVFAGILVITAVALLLWNTLAHHTQHEEKDSEEMNPLPGLTLSDTPAADSCKDARALPIIDSCGFSIGTPGGGPLKREIVNVIIPDSSSVQPKRKQAPKSDTFLSYSVASASDVSKEGKKPMNVLLSDRPQPPYTYILNNDLTLNAPYQTTTGFKFREAGDTVYMTDNDGVSYQLLRNRGQQPLVPVSTVTK